MRYAITMLILALVSCTANSQHKMKPLTPQEKHVIIDKGTDAPFTGKYYKAKDEGLYTCRQCGAELYRSSDKFDSGCGWPSFDNEIQGAVKRTTDADGRRTEITCVKCGGHLGHVFIGEELTSKNTRHCVNSTSLVFVPAPKEEEVAILAGGCFWGVEHLLQQVEGVKSVNSGYIGGTAINPTYEQVCTGKTGHAEAVKVLFNPDKCSYETLAKLFLEIHDPTQFNRQGPDVGNQYRSEIFYTTPAQQNIANKLVSRLKTKGYNVVTKVTKATPFYEAESYHQDYYVKKGSQPYCHSYTKRF